MAFVGSRPLWLRPRSRLHIPQPRPCSFRCVLHQPRRGFIGVTPARPGKRPCPSGRACLRVSQPQPCRIRAFPRPLRTRLASVHHAESAGIASGKHTDGPAEGGRLFECVRSRRRRIGYHLCRFLDGGLLKVAAQAETSAHRLAVPPPGERAATAYGGLKLGIFRQSDEARSYSSSRNGGHGLEIETLHVSDAKTFMPVWCSEVSSTAFTFSPLGVFPLPIRAITTRICSFWKALSIASVSVRMRFCRRSIFRRQRVADGGSAH